MATLRYATTCRLPPPLAPTRKGIQSAADALHSLGFDAAFDLQNECDADAIRARDVKLSQRLRDGIVFARARRRLRTLPYAHVQFVKAIKDDPAADPPEEEHLVSAASIVAQALAACGVVPDDVSIEQEGDCLRGIIQVACGPWLLVVAETLATITKDKGGGLERGDHSGIHRALAEAGGVENLTLHVTPVFANLRCSEEVRLAVSCCQFSPELADRVGAAAAASRQVFAEAWTELNVDDEEKKIFTDICEKAPLACFRGQCMAASEGRRAGLEEDVLEHGARELSELMADAEQAHSQLKELLAPRSTWAARRLNDHYEVSTDDERRRWTSSSTCLAPDGEHYDPGIRTARWVLDKAKRIIRPEEVVPPSHLLVDISRLTITFDTSQSLCAALEKLLGKLNVVTMNNGFANPNCLGYRHIELVVRQHVGARVFLCTLELHHRALVNVQAAADLASGDVRSALLEGGVAARDVILATEAALRGLGCTQWQAIRDAELDLQRVDQRVRELQAAAVEARDDEALQLAEELLHEASKQMSA
eukprot:TRINITY_DN7134_c0_g3_i4.p1 TRINITY_DN7134_c0_g3~~TRINITY_DN7134_c0_g3_i4.p1  ORF type:complete len:572 (+),score=137.57 TRINITY_DN7134_c0_g3_i4:107-1717(+)